MASCPGAPSPPLHAARAGGGAAGGGGSCAKATADHSVQSASADRLFVVIFMGGLLIVRPTATLARPYPRLAPPQKKRGSFGRARQRSSLSVSTGSGPGRLRVVVLEKLI